MKQRTLIVACLVVAFICGGGILVSTSSAQKTSVPRQPDKIAIASEKVKEVLALMDTDKNGKISKQQWMKFMEAEFDKLDKDKKGEVDPKELLPHDRILPFDRK
jgi:hypothetical protein